jgi:hypothetical protein
VPQCSSPPDLRVGIRLTSGSTAATSCAGWSLRLQCLGMRGGTIILLGITALAAYSLGRQGAPATNPPPVLASPSAPLAKPVAYTAAPALAASPAPTPLPTVLSPSSANPASAGSKASVPDKPERLDTKRKVETVLTAAAIAAIIVQASRDQYHAGGRPCACPDDSMRNGRACGARSAYSRPGGAAPLCYPSDVTAAMIESYRQRQASR